MPDAPRGMSRRERQIMDVIYRRGRATAAEVLADLPDPPSYSAVRAMLRLLEEKGTCGTSRTAPAMCSFRRSTAIVRSGRR